MPLHPRFSKGPKLNAVSFQKPSQTCLFPTCQVSEDLSILTFLPRRMQWSVPGPELQIAISRSLEAAKTGMSVSEYIPESMSE
jgi:hypothetical protein